MKLKICLVGGCERKSRALDLCFTHWRRQHRGREVGGPILDSNARICSVEGCERKYHSVGFCKLHYYRRRKGTPLDYAPNYSLVCAQEGCDKNRNSGKNCPAHTQRARLGISMDKPIRGRIIGPVDGLCTVDACFDKHAAKGFCNRHYRNFKKRGLINS